MSHPAPDYREVLAAVEDRVFAILYSEARALSRSWLRSTAYASPLVALFFWYSESTVLGFSIYILSAIALSQVWAWRKYCWYSYRRHQQRFGMSESEALLIGDEIGRMQRLFDVPGPDSETERMIRGTLMTHAIIKSRSASTTVADTATEH